MRGKSECRIVTVEELAGLRHSPTYRMALSRCEGSDTIRTAPPPPPARLQAGLPVWSAALRRACRHACLAGVLAWLGTLAAVDGSTLARLYAWKAWYSSALIFSVCLAAMFY